MSAGKKHFRHRSSRADGAAEFTRRCEWFRVFHSCFTNVHLDSFTCDWISVIVWYLWFCCIVLDHVHNESNSVILVDQWTDFQKLSAYVTHNATEPASDITGDSSSDFSHMCSFTPWDLWTHLNVCNWCNYPLIDFNSTSILFLNQWIVNQSASVLRWMSVHSSQRQKSISTSSSFWMCPAVHSSEDKNTFRICIFLKPRAALWCSSAQKKKNRNILKCPGQFLYNERLWNVIRIRLDRIKMHLWCEKCLIAAEKQS